MELEAAKMIGAGLAAIALAGAGVGIGIIFGNYLSGAMRNPSAAQKQLHGRYSCRHGQINLGSNKRDTL